MNSARTAAAESPAEAPLRVLQVNKNAQGGGAERVAMSIHEGLRRRGHRSWLAVSSKNVDGPGILEIPGRRVRRRRGVRRLIEEIAVSPANAIAARRGREPFDYPGTRRLLELAPAMPDIVHAHNLHGRWFDLRQLAPLSHRVPVAMTLHDEWTYTGHCGYTRGLETWRTGCQHCPDLDIYVPIARDATHANWEQKRRIYVASRLHVSAPSAWLLDRARDSVLATGTVDWRLIPNGVDLARFQPGDRRAARMLLGLPADARILLFTAHRAAASPFKDIETVFAAVRRIGAAAGDQRIVMLALGDEGPPEVSGNAELRFVPYEPDQERLAAYYRAADLYLHAARADNFPTTILEALASGVPVVATAVGGIPEQVRSLAGAPGAWAGDAVGPDAATGVLVGQGDTAGMAAATLHLLADEALRARLADNAARDAAARFDFEDQLGATIAWYRDIIAPA